MQKIITSIEIKKGERLYQLLVASDSPLGELHDVLFEMKNHVMELMKQQNQAPMKMEYVENKE